MPEEPKTAAPQPPAGRQAPPPPQPPGQQPGQEKKSGGIAETFSGLRVSLMPADLEGEKGPDIRIRALILVLVLIVETGAVLAGHYVISQKTEAKILEREKLDQQFAATKAEAARQEKEMEDAMVFSRQIKAATEALDSHVYSTRVVEFVDGNTLDGVEFDRILADLPNGMISLDVQAPKYRRLAEQIVQFEDSEEVIDLKSSSASLVITADGVIEGVSSTILLKVKPSIWLSQPAGQANAQ